MQALFKETDNADWLTMQALKKSIAKYSTMDHTVYGETIERQKKDLKKFMARFFPSQEHLNNS